MALPDNGHHVHDDGYHSERGEPDMERMLHEVADEVGQVEGVGYAQLAGVADPHIEVRFDESLSPDDVQTLIDAEIGPILDGWGCEIVVGNRQSGEMLAEIFPS